MNTKNVTVMNSQEQHSSLNDDFLVWQCRESFLKIPLNASPLIMGILNVTPDSFSDGGQFLKSSDAIKHGLQLAAEGADIIDVGGESSRPGAAEVSLKEELSRTIPVIKRLKQETSCLLSIDTRKAEIAARALEAGADIVNDISALTNEKRMIDVVKSSGAGVVLMHMQGTPENMQQKPEYKDVVNDVYTFLSERIRELINRGINFNSLAIDPGIGFGKMVEHNIKLIASSSSFKKCNRPLLLGLSRKSFIGHLTGRNAKKRLPGSLGAAAFATIQGVDILRVHDVAQTLDAVKVVKRLQREQEVNATGK